MIATLIYRAYRAIMICSKSKLQPEPEKIRSMLISNEYSELIINSTITPRIKQLNGKMIYSVEKCPVYLHLPWIESTSTKYEKQITAAVKKYYFAVEPYLVFTTRQLLPATNKDVLPAHQNCVPL